MVMAEHICPWGLKARHLLRRHGFAVDDRWLTSRAETDAFKAAHDVKTTPQVFIGGERIGGYDDLRRYFGLKVRDPEATSYVPVAVVFATSAGLALAASTAAYSAPLTGMTLQWFVSFAMMLLAMFKLQDLESFATMFLGYDLLAQRWLPYAYLYPFLEWSAGGLMAAERLAGIAIPAAGFIGSVGAISVLYAVYVQKREIKCACVGGSSRVPLGFVSLTENLGMLAMAGWMLVSHMGIAR
ncbi:MAG: glutaredoxin [Sphingomonadales bacterium]|nr:glutaredoxin [Sphingomonadales bacterium]